MSGTSDKRRMTENQAVFRRHNEQVKRDFDKITEVARDSGQEYLLKDHDTALHFVCECSDEDCRQRIQMKPSRYRRIHSRRDHFTIMPGHEVPSIESVVDTQDGYIVVEKFVTPSEDVKTLKPTEVSNA